MPAPLHAYLVEDSPLLQANLIAALEEMAPVKVVGTAVDENAARAWLIAHPHDCDLMIIDIFLQRGSGLGVLEAIRHADGAMQRVVLSNYATPDMRQRCLNLGAARVFDKSTDIDELVDYCQQLADR